MRAFPSDVAFTPAVKAIQERKGSRQSYARMERGDGWQTTVTPDLAEFLADLDMFYLGTANADGQPYIQYRGGPPGFLKVIDDHTLGFADFGGNRQYVTLGNLSENPKAFLFLMDYANQRRVKVWGTARVVEGDAALEEKLRDPAYPGEVERAILFTVEAWDVNCPQHIHQRFSQRQIAPVIEKLQARIAELEAEVERLRASPPSTNEARSMTMDFTKTDTALVVIDPQNDVLSEKGVSWGLVGASVRENNTVENLDRLFKAAKDRGYGVFISPALPVPARPGVAVRRGRREVDAGRARSSSAPTRSASTASPAPGPTGSTRYKPFIEDGKTVVVSPHKVWGPQTNDLVLQLRKRGVDKVILAGMLANLCVESHLRELIEQGFEVAVVKDATAGPRHPEIGDGYKAAVVNYGFIANAVLTTDDAVKAMK